jgi:hypothetical protein
MRYAIIPLIMVLIIGPGWAQENIKIAVLDLKARTGIDKMTVSSLTDYTCTVISELGNYDVIGKDDMQAMLEHISDKQLLECDDTKCLTTIGGALGVGLLVSGNIGMVGKVYLINLKLIDIENAKVKNRLSEEYQGDETGLVGQLKESVQKLFKAEQPGEEIAEPAWPQPVQMETPAPEKLTAPAGRNWHFVVRAGGAFSTYQGAGPGFGVTVGIQYPQNYFGINFTAVNHSTDEVLPTNTGFDVREVEERQFNGLGLVYYHRLNSSPGFGFSIGGTLGFYRGYYEYFQGDPPLYEEPHLNLVRWHELEKQETQLIGLVGPKIRLDINRKHLGLTAESTLLIGPGEERAFQTPDSDMDKYDKQLNAAGQLGLSLLFSM